MNLIKLSIAIFILNLMAVGIFAQSDSCPTITIKSPAGILSEGETMTFTAEVKGLPENSNLTFNWTVNAGTIVSGQGTPVINVSTEDRAGTNITATVEVSSSSIPNICNRTAGETGIVAEKVKARLIKQMKNPNCEYRQMNMDNFFIELTNEPNATGYIFIFGSPRRVAQQEKAMRANIKWRNFDGSRFVFVNGGGSSKYPTVEFWLVPAGADIPIPEPPDEDEADFDKPAENTTETKIDPKKPFIHSFEYYDGGACIGDNPEIDLEGYAEYLKANPKSRGNIVISMLTKAEFREKEKEILDFLKSKGIARSRLRTFHQKTFGGVELWILP